MTDARPPAPIGDPPPMDIVIACCRDEADIIRAFIDFYLDQGFDRICLIDNGSVDDTIEQVMHHPAQDRILLLRDPRPGYDMRLLDYYRMFAGPSVRWVFFIDVDEFVVLPGGIKTFAETIPPNVTLLELPTAEMQPVLTAEGEAAPLLSRRREARFEGESAARSAELKVVWKAVQVQTVYCGKHDVVIEPRIAHRDDRVYIRHYHTRSRSQFIRKLANRIETEEAMGARADELTLFSRSVRQNWIHHSRRLLQADGWAIEAERTAGLCTVAESAIADWYLQRGDSTGELVISPLVRLRGDSDAWFCACVQSYRPTEGHTGRDHLILLFAPDRSKGPVDRPIFQSGARVTVRLHSECLLGDIFASSRCDCSYQLAAGMEAIEAAGGGVLVYLRQEGRGVGLMDKLRSLAVDHEDTFYRNEAIGRPGDIRRYRMAGEILRRLGVAKAHLLSGNHAKAESLRAAGIDTVVDNRLALSRIAPEAVSEIQAKLRKGYTYDLIGTGNGAAKDPLP
jgi:GTP cyclohydrolase II